MLQSITDWVDVEAGQFRTLVLGLGICRVGPPTSSLLPSPLGGVLEHCPQLIHLTQQCVSSEAGSTAFMPPRVSSPTPVPSGPECYNLSGEEKVQLC